MPTISTIIRDYPQPALARAVIRQLGDDDDELVATLRDVRDYGAQGGVAGFIYTAETVAFWRSHRADILARLTEYAEDFGQGIVELVAGFNCLNNDYTIDEVGRALYGRYDSDLDTNYNALAWFALEDVARFAADQLDEEA